MARAESGPAAMPLHVEVLFSPAPRQVRVVALELPIGSTVADALRASGLLEETPETVLDALRLGVWGRVQAPGWPLREGDRVEIYRPLTVDPKEARRQRYKRQRRAG
jgi:uncharacterized protein